MKTREMILCAVFAAISAIIAPISIPIGAVPVSLGVAAVLLSGGILRPRDACISQIVYLLIGCIGLPVFSGFTGGIQKLAGPTGGYLFVYPVMALVVSLLAGWSGRKIGADRKWLRAAAMYGAMLPAVVLCYASGSLYYSIQAGVSLQKALAVTAIPFIPWDLVKAAAAAALSLAVRPRLTKLF